jgi:hypothetical protein
MPGSALAKLALILCAEGGSKLNIMEEKHRAMAVLECA